MQPVDQEQASHHAVVGHPEPLVAVQLAQQPRQALAVQLEDRGREILRQGTGLGIRDALERAR